MFIDVYEFGTMIHDLKRFIFYFIFHLLYYEVSGRIHCSVIRELATVLKDRRQLRACMRGLSRSIDGSQQVLDTGC